MARFRVDDEIFARLPDACFGVVVAQDVTQPEPASPAAQAICRQLEEAIESVRKAFLGANVKTHPDIEPYRQAFQRLGFNPNKFASSIEAMVARVAKGGSIPSINPAVDLANASGLRNVVPLGVHDLDCCQGFIEVRLSKAGDIFTPFGSSSPEAVEPGEVVYADGTEVRTRRWIWRQGEYSKATTASRNLFYPIDGFRGANDNRVLKARTELAAALAENTGAKIAVGWVDRDQRSIEL